MDISLTYRGIVTYFSPEKRFGFLDTEDREGIFFFVDMMQFKDLPKEEKKELKFNFIRGDEVFFKIKYSEKNESGFEAFDLKFIKNDKVDQLYELVEVNKELAGYLKKIGTNYFIKDKTTYLFIPIKISAWEIGLEQIYEQRINKPVFYTILSKPKKPENLRAVLCDRVLSDSFYQLEACKEKNIPIKATITGKNKDGYFVTILSGKVSTFIPFEKDGTVPSTFNKRDEVEITIKSIYESGVRVQLA
jgi:cold shock CspA family protein